MAGQERLVWSSVPPLWHSKIMTIEIMVQDKELKALVQAGLTTYAADLAGKATLIITDDPQNLREGTVCLLLVPDITVFSVPPSIASANIFAAPFRLGALLDRARLLLDTDMSGWRRGAVLTIGPFLLYLDDSRLVDAARDITIRLTEKERDILIKLHDYEGQVMAREDLLRDVWGYAKGLETHTLETHIYRLRQKIEHDPANPVFLLTEDNGYRLAV